MSEAIRTGDQVKWESTIFKGGFNLGSKFKGAKPVGKEVFEGKVIKHSYGEKTKQHTFTILLNSGKKKLVKGRNLYPHLIDHQIDENSPDRKVLKKNKDY